MKNVTLRLFSLLFLILFLSSALDVRSSTAIAQIQNTYGYTCVSYIPAEWGEYRGGDQQSGLAFQDRSGTLRFVTNLPCNATPQPALEIRRITPTSN